MKSSTSKSSNLAETIKIVPFVFLMLFMLKPDSLRAQVEGLTLRTPPITHAFIDSGEILAGVSISYTKIENPGYQIANIDPESITTIDSVGYLALGLSDSFAIGLSSSPSRTTISGNDADTGESRETTINSNSTYYYLIPTLYRWKENRMALIWGKGRATIEENSDLNISYTDYEIGTTGLIGEFYFSESVSFVPWMSWPYLLFDFFPPSTAEIQEPDYGFDIIFHVGDAKLSLSLIIQALDTIDKSSEEERTESETDEEASQESYSISVSMKF